MLPSIACSHILTLKKSIETFKINFLNVHKTCLQPKKKNQIHGFFLSWFINESFLMYNFVLKRLNWIVKMWEHGTNESTRYPPSTTQSGRVVLPNKDCYTINQQLYLKTWRKWLKASSASIACQRAPWPRTPIISPYLQATRSTNCSSLLVDSLVVSSLPSSFLYVLLP